MKKFAKIMAVALVAVMALAVLVACAPASDPQKALDALKKHGYTTTGSAIAADNVASKTACDLMGVTFGVKSGELIAIVTGTKLEETKDEDVNGEMVSIYYFSSSAVAKQAWEGSFFQKLKEEAEKDEDNDAIIKLSGSMIYAGTSAGIKAAR